MSLLLAASAATAPSQPADRLGDAARLYYSGKAALAEGRTDEALLRFEEAYAVLPRPALLLEIAQCQEALGRSLEAMGTRADYQRIVAGASSGAARPSTPAVVSGPAEAPDAARRTGAAENRSWWVWFALGGVALAAGGIAAAASGPEIVEVPATGSLGTLDARRR